MQLFEDNDDFVDDNRPRVQFNSLTDKRGKAAESFNAQEYNVTKFTVIIVSRIYCRCAKMIRLPNKKFRFYPQ